VPDFLTSLARWRGRFFVKAELESRGFMVPSRFQAHVQDECADDSGSSLDRYWDEEAREYICSAGRTDSQARSFPHPQAYRSQYLDELALSRKAWPYTGIAPLHPCLYEYARRSRTIEFTRPVIQKMEDLKKTEIKKLEIRADCWSGSKKDAGRILVDRLQVRGFSKKGKSLVRCCPSTGLVFGAFADTGGRPYCIAVPFHFFIAEDSSKVEIFEFSPARVLRGFWYYSRFDTAESAVLGFHAYAEMIDVMSRSFE
jgi:hypothetical protein